MGGYLVDLFKVNVGGLKNVLQAYKEAGTIEKIVYPSSFFALGPTDGYVADETQTHSGKFFCTEYEKSKAVADKVALDAVSEGVPIVLVYPGVIYGPGKVTAGNVVARMLIERFNGCLPGYISQANDRCSFSHVDDVVDGHIAAMDKGKPGERYLLTGENASFKEVFDIAAIITQTKRPSFVIPLLIIEAYGWISVLFSKLTRKLPLISPPISNRLILQVFICYTGFLLGDLHLAHQQAIYPSQKTDDDVERLLHVQCIVVLADLHFFSVTFLTWFYTDLNSYRLFIHHLEQTVCVLRHQWAYSCDKAKAELDYHPRSLKEGLSEVLPWLKNLGLIKY